MNLANHLGRFSWAVITRILPLINGLLLVIFIIPNLPVAEFGKYSIIFAIATQVIFINKSFVLNPMIKFAAEPGKFDVMARTGFFLNAIFYISVGCILSLLAPILAKMLQIEPRDIILSVAFLPLFFLRDWSFCIQQTLYRMRRLFLLDSIYYIGSGVGYIYLWYYKKINSATEILYINFIAAFCSSLVAVIIGSGVKNLFSLIKLNDAKQILQYGYWTIKIGLFSSLIAGIDSIILGFIYNPALVGVYNGAKKVYQIVSAFTSAVGVLVMPYVSRLSSNGQYIEVKVLFEKIIGYVSLGLIIWTIFIWLSAGYLFDIFLGEAYRGSAPVLRVMMFAAPFEGLFITAGTILYGIGVANIAANVSGWGILLLLILLPIGSYMGASYGAAIAMVLTLVICGVMMYIRTEHYLNSSIKGILNRLLNVFKMLRFTKIK